MTLLCIYQHPLPLKNTTPSFLSSPPLLNLETVRAPFLGHPPLYIGFSWNPLTPVKLGFFREPQKYKGFSSFSPSYLLKITKFLVKISEFPWKKSPLLSQQPSSKSWGPVKLPFFWKIGSSFYLPPAERAGGRVAHYECFWTGQSQAKTWNKYNPGTGYLRSIINSPNDIRTKSWKKCRSRKFPSPISCKKTNLSVMLVGTFAND